MLNNKIFSLISLLLFFSAISYGKEFRTSSAKEIREALKETLPGDTIIMLNGNWIDQEIKFETTGTEEKPIILKAEIPGKVILSGSSKLRIGGDHLIVDGLFFKNGNINKGAVIEFRDGDEKGSTNCRLTNSAIVDYNPPEKSTEYKWVSLYGEHNRVDNCYFRNKTNAGCLLVVWLSEKPNYHLIDSNYFAFRPELGENGGEIIRVGTSHWSMYPSHTIVENNYFEDCNGEREIISNKSFFNIYRHNTFVRCKGTLTLRHGNKCTVEGNFFFGENIPMTGGIRIIGEDHKVINNYFQDLAGEDVFSALPIMNGVADSPLNRYFQVKNALIAFNTFVNCKYNIVIGTGADEELSLNPINSTVANNIFLGKENTVITKISEPENFHCEGNIYYGIETEVESEGFKNIDPELYFGENGFYRPSETSPAINNAAGNYDFIKNDIDGQERSEQKDIGCDEVIKDYIYNKPLDKFDVGPRWMKTLEE